jgi:hypothetical protein
MLNRDDPLRADPDSVEIIRVPGMVGTGRIRWCRSAACGSR